MTCSVHAQVHDCLKSGAGPAAPKRHGGNHIVDKMLDLLHTTSL